MRHLLTLFTLAALALGVAAFDTAQAARVTATIDLSAQRMYVAIGGKPAYAWPVSTGKRGYRTPTGNYRPTRMYRKYFSRKYDGSPMPNSIFFRGGYAIHGTNSIFFRGGYAIHGTNSIFFRGGYAIHGTNSIFFRGGYAIHGTNSIFFRGGYAIHGTNSIFFRGGYAIHGTNSIFFRGGYAIHGTNSIFFRGGYAIHGTNSIFFRGGYAIHGTYYTKALGRPASHGCVRLAPRNARALYNLVRTHGRANTRIRIRR